jgi:hypothetical protein
MNDHELHRLVAEATHVRDSWVAGFDLRAAEDELLEEIMATTDFPTSAGAAPPGAPPPDGPPAFRDRPSRFKLAVAVGVAAALVVGVVVVRSLSGGDAGGVERGDVTSGGSAITPMIADPVPAGLEAYDIYPAAGPGPTDTETDADTVIFGVATATALEDDVVVFVEATAPDGEIVGGRPVTVRGQEGTVAGGDGDLSLSWTEPAGVHLTLNSHTFDQDQLVAIAEGLVVDGSHVELGDVPEGVTKPPKVAELDRFGGPGYYVSYGSVGTSAPSYQVAIRAVDEGDRMYELWLRGPRDDGQVDGHDLGLLSEGGGVYDLAWEPTPGQVVEVLAQGTTEEAARAFAETMRTATPDEWAALQDQVASATADDDGAVVMPEPPDDAAYRELANGAEVWGWVNDEDELCYHDAHPQGGESELCHGDPAEPALGVSPSTIDGELVSTVPAVVGVAPEGTATIDGGELTFGEEVDGGQVYVWEFAGSEMPETLTFRDAAGEEITTAEVVVI